MRLHARPLVAILLAAFAVLPAVRAQDHSSHVPHAMQAGGQPATDARVPVRFPPELREHTLANMRDHLLALQQIQHALSVLDHDKAGEIAEQRLGMSSLSLHGAHDVVKFMPQGMQDAGTAMHRNASRFALAVREAGATGDLRPPLAALASLTAACVACHAGYRFE